MAKGKIDDLCKYLENSKAKRYPINNKILWESTDFIRNGYLKMLAVIMQQADEITEAQMCIFKRIVTGSGTEENYNQYLRMALDIEIEDFLKFTDELKRIALKYRFILDAVILVGVEKKNDEQIALVAEFCEVLGIERNNVWYITAMARAILEMNLSKYVDAYEIKTDTVPDYIFNDYMYLISKSCICCNDHLTIFQPTCDKDVTVEVLEKIKTLNTPRVKLINVTVDLSEYPLLFSDREEVIIESCHFTKGLKYSVSFKNCKNVRFSNTTFDYFKYRAINVENVRNLTIQGSYFYDCRFHYEECSGDWKLFGGVIYSDKPFEIGEVNIQDSVFKTCGGVNKVCFYRTACISNIKCNVNNCTFNNCWHWHNINVIDPNEPRRTMFVSGSKAIHCNIENSALFCR